MSQYIQREKNILRYNTACTNAITIDGEDLEDVKLFKYLDSIIDEEGGSDADVKAWIVRSRAAYLQLRNVWNSEQLSTNTKQQSTVGENKPDPSGGRNQEEALEEDRTHIEESIQMCHKASPHMESSKPKERGRSKNTLHRKTEIDMRKMNKNWMEPEKKTQERMRRRMLVGDLCSIRSNRRK
ncbi:unnamed protein product [Schistosoma margrebowiei]|uniref:Uncharacterized protein n=1 Tax=Schistosoma margrebowiei TaxID=48269 RepID=A0A183LU53_9TREM|nr:unnamed protein product [Schistosoma margrebowiei]